MFINEDRMQCILDSARGVYIPQNFAELHAHEWEHITDEQLQVLLAGPEHADYWDTWNMVENNAIYRDEHGSIWTLYHNMDLFMVHEDYDWNNPN